MAQTAEELIHKPFNFQRQTGNALPSFCGRALTRRSSTFMRNGSLRRRRAPPKSMTAQFGPFQGTKSGHGYAASLFLSR